MSSYFANILVCCSFSLIVCIVSDSSQVDAVTASPREPTGLPYLLLKAFLFNLKNHMLDFVAKIFSLPVPVNINQDVRTSFTAPNTRIVLIWYRNLTMANWTIKVLTILYPRHLQNPGEHP